MESWFNSNSLSLPKFLSYSLDVFVKIISYFLDSPLSDIAGSLELEKASRVILANSLEERSC